MTDTPRGHSHAPHGSDLTDADAEALDAEPMCVGRAIDITGHDVAAWVIPHMNWRGKARYEPRVERYFVGWDVSWRGYRRRTFDAAKRRALAALHDFDRKGGRRG